MVRMDDPFDTGAEHGRFAAYRRGVSGGELLEGILDQLANDPDQAMADGVRTRLLDLGTTRDDVTQLIARPGFSSPAMLRKAEGRFAVLDARQAQSQEQLLVVVATGIKRAHMQLLEREDLPQGVLVTLALKALMVRGVGWPEPFRALTDLHGLPRRASQRRPRPLDRCASGPR